MSEQMKRKIGFKSHDDEDDDMDEEMDMAQVGHVADLGEYLASLGGAPEEMPAMAPVIHFKPVIKIVNCNCCKKHKKKKKK